MAAKFRKGDVVRVNEKGRCVMMTRRTRQSFRNARWHGIITHRWAWPSSCPYDCRAGKRGRGRGCPFDARELDLVERPKKGAKR